MSSPTVHIAEQPDILGPDAEWRKLLADIVQGLTEDMLAIERLVGTATGSDEAVEKLMETLRKLEERQTAAVHLYEQHQAAWRAAISSQDRTLGELDSRLIELRANVEQSEGIAPSLKEQKEQIETLLTSLRQRVSQAKRDFQQTQAIEASINEAHQTELKSGPAKQNEDLGGQKKEQVEREVRHRARVDAFDPEAYRRREDLVSREKEQLTSEQDIETAARNSEAKNLQTLEMKIKQRDLQIQLLEEGRRTLDADVKQRDYRIQHLEERQRSLESDKNTRIQNLKADIKQKDFRIKALSGEQQSLESDLNSRIHTLEADIEKKDLRIQVSHDHRRSLESDLMLRNSRIQDLDEGCQSLENSKQEVVEENQRLSETIGELQEQNKQREQLFADSTESLRLTREANKRLTAQVNDQRKEVESFNDECNRLFAERNRLIADHDRRTAERADRMIHRDSLFSTANDATAEIEPGRSSHKRTHDEMDAEMEEAPSADESERMARRSGKAPDNTLSRRSQGTKVDPIATQSLGTLGSRGQGTATESSLGVQGGGTDALNIGNARQPPISGPGTQFQIEDVLKKDFTAPPIPQAILTRLRGQIREWDSSSYPWRKGTGRPSLRRCAHSATRRRATVWKDGDSYQACQHCIEARRLCVVADDGKVELLPFRKAQGTWSIGDEDYWLGSRT